VRLDTSRFVNIKRLRLYGALLGRGHLTTGAENRVPQLPPTPSKPGAAAAGTLALLQIARAPREHALR
jgi:hypothetical protein